MSSQSSQTVQPTVRQSETQVEDRWEKRKRWLIMFATVIAVIFLIYLFLILVFPSMNIGTSS